MLTDDYERHHIRHGLNERGLTVERVSVHMCLFTILGGFCYVASSLNNRTLNVNYWKVIETRSKLPNR